MRRFASVFARKDKDAREPKPDPRRANSLLPLAPAPAPTPVPSFGSDPLSSASSAGSASLSLQTPDDDPVLTRSATKSKSWTSWLGKKSGGTIKRGRPADQPSPIDQLWVEPIPDWRPTQPPPLLRAAPVPKSPPAVPVPVLDIDSDEDASSSESDEDESVSLPHPAAARHPPITPTPVAQSRKNLEIFIQNSLVPPLAPSPFAHLVGAPMYPRSSNPPHSLPARQSMQAVMHKTLLLRRLQRSDLSTRTVAQQQLDRSILPFASRPPPAAVNPPAPLPWFNDRALPASLMLSPSSAGLRRWMSRPCFEERIAVWVPMNGAVACQAVTGSSLAVAELEYSAALDAMIGFGLPPVEEEPSSPVTPVPTPQPQPVAAPAAVRNTPFHAAPSPLRRSTLKSPPSQSSISQIPPPPARADSLPPPPPVASSSRVRFAEDDDKDSAIPLGYALRVKKRREEKAKFLREEQERRAFEEERAKQEAERLKRELERTKWEEEKRAWEMEKRAMEEERKKRIYAEEVAAARLRREHQRLGGGHGSSASNDLLAPSSSTTFLRDERNKHSRPLHDQRRQTSESAVPQHGRAPSGSPNTSSPGSSRPPSVVGHNHTGSMGRASARPPSLHASSSEDVRPQQSNSAKAAKRSSMASLPGRNPTFDWSSTYSAWSASNPTLQVPPMPQVPMYGMDMPLLPPTPPFMLQQYPRPRQNSHSGSSPSPSRSRLPSNASSERVNAPNGQSSSRRGSTASSSPHRPGPVQRRSSDDPRRASLPPSKPSSTRSHSKVAVSRGRPPIPSSYQAPPVPSPWTAPPLTTSYSHQQLSPAAIISGYGQRPPPQSKRRQTTIS